MTVSNIRLRLLNELCLWVIDLSVLVHTSVIYLSLTQSQYSDSIGHLMSSDKEIKYNLINIAISLSLVNMDSREIRAGALGGIKVFSDVGSRDMHSIFKHITWHEYTKGETILNCHEQTDDVYFIKEGAVRATTYSASGKEISFQDLSDGDMFGELSALDHQGRITSIITLNDCLIGKMSAARFIQTINDFPSVNRKVMLRLTGLIRFLCGRIYEYSALDVKDRIRAEIIRLARSNANGTNSALIENMPTHEEIANKISTHREAVTKEFSYLDKEKLIEKHGRKIRVPNIEKLSARLFEEV